MQIIIVNHKMNKNNINKTRIKLMQEKKKEIKLKIKNIKQRRKDWNNKMIISQFLINNNYMNI